METDPSRKRQRYEDALAVLTRGEALSPRQVSYDLACVHARLGDNDKCREYLERCIEYGELPTRSHLESDPDLDSVRGDPWFADILDRAPKP